MSHPIAETASLELGRSAAPGKVMHAVVAWIDRMCHLDEGMIEGRALPRAEVDVLYAELVDLTRAAFLRAAAGDAIGAVVKTLGQLPIYRRPKRCDLAEWARTAEAARAQPVAPAPASDVLDSAALEPKLLGAFRALITMVAADPARHQLHAPASLEAVAQWEVEHELKLPPDLAALYRVSDGFSLYLDDQQAEGVGLRMVPLRELALYADLVDEPRRSSRAKTDRARAESNERLCVFDLGNGDFLSCLPLRSGRTLWIDDWHEVPSPLRFATVAEVLEHLTSPARIDPQGRWYAGLD